MNCEDRFEKSTNQLFRTERFFFHGFRRKYLNTLLTAYALLGHGDVGLALAGGPAHLALAVVLGAVGAADGRVHLVAVGALAEGEVVALHAHRVVVARPPGAGAVRA